MKSTVRGHWVCGAAQELNEWEPFWKPKKASTELLLARSRTEAPGPFAVMSPAVTSSRACLWLSLTILALAPPAGSIPAPFAERVIYLPTLLQSEERQSLADKLRTSSARLSLAVIPS